MPTGSSDGTEEATEEVAVDEVGGAVDAGDYPAIIALSLVLSRLLGQHGMVG